MHFWLTLVNCGSNLGYQVSAGPILVCPLACFQDDGIPPHSLLSAGLRWEGYYLLLQVRREDRLYNVSDLHVLSFLQGVVKSESIGSQSGVMFQSTFGNICIYF